MKIADFRFSIFDWIRGILKMRSRIADCIRSEVLGRRPTPAFGHPSKEGSKTGVHRTLEGRIVICLDCDTKAQLITAAGGNLVCGVCGSMAWMHDCGQAMLIVIEKMRSQQARQVGEIERLCALPEDKQARVQALKQRALARVERAGKQV